MTYYLRIIKKERWDNCCTDLNDLSGEAVTIDWNCSKNEWSVYEYKCDKSLNFEKTEEINKIVLLFSGKNPRKAADGVDLFFVESDFIKKIGMKISSDNEKEFGCLHCNIRKVNFQKICEIIKYTNNNLINRTLSYSPLEIKELLLNLSENSNKEYVSVIGDQNYKFIQKAFLADK